MADGTQQISRLIAAHRQSGVLVDTNLLILLLIGLLHPRYIPQFSRTKSYTDLEFQVLRQVLENFRKIVVTPHILTEVSNLVGRMDHRLKYNLFTTLAGLLADPAGSLVLDEQHRPAGLVSREPEFYRLGLTDAGIIHRAAHKRYLVLTDDAPLGVALSQRHIDFLTLATLVVTASS